VTPQRKTTVRQAALRVLLGLALGWGAGEVLLADTDLEMAMMWSTLYFVEGGFNYVHETPTSSHPDPSAPRLELYRPSEKPGLVYELVPGASGECTNCTHPAEPKGKTTRVAVNSLGFRGPERSVAKAPGVRRIIVFGGSNTYGPSVSDEDTLPALLEARLNAREPGRYEVWNGGLNAYRASQMVIVAREAIANYAPDLLLFQYAPQGRRAFFHRDETPGTRFELDPSLHQENALLPKSFPGFLQPPHRLLVRVSRLYRVLVAFNIQRVLSAHSASNPSFLTEPVFDYSFSVEHNWALWTEFVEQHPDVDILLIDPEFRLLCDGRTWEGECPTGREECRNLPERDPEAGRLRYFSYCPTGFGEWRMLHPPSYVYEDYATDLAPVVRATWR
jgi:hypothetical protein